LRGRSELDPQGRLQRASGVVSDAQRQQKRVREREQGRRFLRAIFDSQRVPQAVVDSSAVITDCNQAWLALDEPACHAGREFGPGRKFTSPPDEPERFGDLDAAVLARGVKQVLGGVVEHYECEYGDGKRRWRVSVSALLNPGIAGAVIGHEEVTAARRADLAARKRLAALEADFRAMEVPFFRVGPDFEIKAANEAAKAVGRAPVIGRDVLQVLPRVDADAVSDGLVALSSGARTATRDTKLKDGRVTRWLLSVRDDEDGNDDGFLLFGVSISDLVSEEETVPDAVHQRELGELRKALGQTETERERLGKLLAELESRAGELRANLERSLLEAEDARRDADAAKREADKARRDVEAARQDAERASGNAEEVQRALLEKDRVLEEAQRRQAELQQDSRKLAESLEAERARHGEALAALSAAGQVPLKMRSELDRARHALQLELDELLERVFQPLLADSAAATPDKDGDGST
jgi:PAS domain-containing protein